MSSLHLFFWVLLILRVFLVFLGIFCFKFWSVLRYEHLTNGRTGSQKPDVVVVDISYNALDLPTGPQQCR